MPPTPTAVARIRTWLHEHFPRHQIESGYLFNDEATWFRARPQPLGAGSLELELRDEDFEDYPVESIVEALEAKKVADKLKSSPGKRLYFRIGPG
jgi:gamma-glutamyl:cysteine ligase YbdK (ATP-grasp superfamily)